MKIKDQLIRMRLPAGASEERCWNFYADNNRLFEIRQFGARKFLLGEFKPNGRHSMPGDESGNIHHSEIVENLLLTGTPNEFFAHVKAQTGLDPSHLVLIGPGIGLTSYYHDSLESACIDIENALAANTWYYKQVELSEDERKALESSDAFDSVQFWQTCKDSAEAAGSQAGLFKGCHTALGPELSVESKNEILAYLNAPSQAAWLNIRSKLITVSTSLWSAWVDFSPNAPRSGNNSHPSAEVLRKAIRGAVAKWIDHVHVRLEEAQKRASTAGQLPERKLEVIHGLR